MSDGWMLFWLMVLGMVVFGGILTLQIADNRNVMENRRLCVEQGGVVAGDVCLKGVEELKIVKPDN